MPWLIFALGVGLALAGGASVYSGYPYLQMEWGWTEVIAGSTAISGGIVTFALGAVLFRLGSLQRLLAQGQLRMPPSIADRLAEAPPPDAGQLPPPPPREPDANPRPHAPDRFIDDEGTAAPATMMPSEGASPAAAEPLPIGMLRRSRDVDEATTAPPASVPQEPARQSLLARVAARFGTGARQAHREAAAWKMARSGLEPASARDHAAPADERQSDLDVSPDPVEPASSASMPSDAARVEEPTAPTVIGRYESGGSSYVLFSDGTIDVETDGNTRRFGSMEELKVFIEQEPESAGSEARG